VLLPARPYGHYVQLGEAVKGEKVQAQACVVAEGNAPGAGRLGRAALKLLALPRELGAHPENRQESHRQHRPLRPLYRHDGKFKSIPRSDSIFDIGLERAVELLAQARDGNTVLRTLGDHPDDKASVEICSGRYGPYARHGKVNATLPKGVSPDEITLEEALELIAAKAAKADGEGRAAKKPAAKQRSLNPRLRRRRKLHQSQGRRRQPSQRPKKRYRKG